MSITKKQVLHANKVQAEVIGELRAALAAEKERARFILDDLTRAGYDAASMMHSIAELGRKLQIFHDYNGKAKERARKAETERDDLKLIAEKCLDPEYMKSMTESVLVIQCVKRVKDAESLEKEAHDKLLAEVQSSMIYQAQVAALTEKLKATEEIIGLVCSERFSAIELFKAADKYRFAISKLSGAGEGRP